MQKDLRKPARSNTGSRAGIWLALVLALAMHGLLLFLPVSGQSPAISERQRPVEVQLSRFEPVPVKDVDPKLAEQSEPAEPAPEPLPPAPQAPVETPAEAATEVAPPLQEMAARPPKPDFEAMSEPEKEALTSTILARQFITEESVADQLFGKPPVQDNAGFQKEFHYPLRPDLVEMLDRPLPDLPFAYTPGLVYFAYDPGVKGDLQRFWDVITPEFGWRTKYGTEFRCVLVLVIVGCGWK